MDQEKDEHQGELSGSVEKYAACVYLRGDETIKEHEGKVGMLVLTESHLLFGLLTEEIERKLGMQKDFHLHDLDFQLSVPLDALDPSSTTLERRKGKLPHLQKQFGTAEEVDVPILKLSYRDPYGIPRRPQFSLPVSDGRTHELLENSLGDFVRQLKEFTKNTSSE